MNLTTILNLVRKPANARDELVAALADLDVDQAERRAADLEAKRRRTLIDGDDRALAAIEEQIVAANRQIERTIALREELQARLDGMDAEAAEDARRKAYDFARAQRSGAEKAFRKYASLAKQIVDQIEEIARIEATIASANADLPSGAEPLLSAEATFRGLPAESRDLVSEEAVPARWYFASDGGAPVESEDVSRIISADGRTGRFEVSRDGARRPVLVEKRAFSKKTYNEARPAFEPVPLAAAITLPGLMPGQSDIWEAWPAHDPADVLSRIEAARQEWQTPACDPRYPRATITRVFPVSVDEDREAA